MAVAMISLTGGLGATGNNADKRNDLRNMRPVRNTISGSNPNRMTLPPRLENVCDLQ